MARPHALGNAAANPMPARQRPPVGAAPVSWSLFLLGAFGGAAWQVRQAYLWPAGHYLALFAAGCLGCCWLLWQRRLVSRRPWRESPGTQGRGLGRGSQLRTALCAAVCAAAMVGGSTGWRAQHYAQQGLDPSLQGQDLQLTGRVASMTQTVNGGLRWLFEVEHAQRLPMPVNTGPTAEAMVAQPATAVRVPPLVNLAWYAPRERSGSQAGGAGGRAAQQNALPALEPGQRWSVHVRLQRPHGSRNPHGFDFELWQWEQGVQATGTVRSMELAAGEGGSVAHWVQRMRQKVRDAIQLQAVQGQRLWTSLGPAPAGTMGIVAALVVGDQQAISRADWTLFRHTGVAHLMAISGLHITLFAWLARGFLGWFWRRSAWACLRCPAQRVALIGGVLLAAAYAVFSGWGVPAQRTVLMLATVALLRSAGVLWPWPAVWTLALAVVAVADPWALWQAGFWLSFVAVGVLFAIDTGNQGQARPAWYAQAWQLWRQQWLITLALSPLGLLLFGQLSLAGLLANMLAIPWVTLVVTPLALLGVFWAPLWTAAGWALAPLMRWLQALDQWSLSVLYLAQPPLWVSLAAIVAGLVLIAPLPRGWRWWGLAGCLPALWWPGQTPVAGSFELLAADVGQGSAVIVRTAAHSLLYDAGPRYSPDADAGERVLVPLLQALGLRLDALVLSHRDNDHTGGALAVQASQPQAVVMGSDSVIDDKSLAGLGPVQACRAGQSWQWDGVRFDVLHPGPAYARAASAHEPVAPAWLHSGAAWPPSPPASSRKSRAPSTNAGSCVLRVQAANGVSALLAGDIEAAQEAVLLRQGVPLQADWLLVPHHGSKSSSSAAWVAAVRPRWAVVQAGYRNRFGHPAPEVVQRYGAQGATVVQTPGCGAAWWSSARPTALQCERRRAPRYWDSQRPAQ